MTLRGPDPDVAEPVITVRAQLRSPPGAHSRDPLTHPGYACFKQIKQRRRVATRHDWLAAIYVASSNLHPFGFRHSPSSPRYGSRSKGPNKADSDLIHRNC